MIPFGLCRSRLILGANPINGGSHLSRFVNNQMKRYFTPEQIQATLTQCQAEGINTWQSGPGGNLIAYRQYVAHGGEMHYIALASQSEANPTMLQDLVAGGAIGVAHHGEVTDVFWREGKMDQVQDYCKQIRDAGIQVGSHPHSRRRRPVVSEGWDVDFYVLSLRAPPHPPAVARSAGHVPLPHKAVYLERDHRCSRLCAAPATLPRHQDLAGRLATSMEWWRPL